MASGILAVLVCLLAYALLHADPPPPEDYVAPEREDVSGDGVDDTLIASPADPVNPRPGEVYVHSGDDGDFMMMLSGESNDDWFGYSLAVVGDVGPDGGDGLKDLLVGAPRGGSGRRGRSFLFYGPFDDLGPEEVTAENADVVFDPANSEASRIQSNLCTWARIAIHRIMITPPTSNPPSAPKVAYLWTILKACWASQHRRRRRRRVAQPRRGQGGDALPARTVGRALSWTNGESIGCSICR